MRLCLLAFLTFSVGFSMARLQYRGFDWTWSKSKDFAQVNFKDRNGNVKPLEYILKENGVNIVSQRIFYDYNYNTVDKDSQPMRLKDNIELARRAKEAKLMVHIEFMYSPVSTSPSRQTIPFALNHLSTDQMCEDIRKYTQKTLEAFADEGIQVEMATLGHEVRQGILGSKGHFTNAGGVKRTSMFLKAASKGVKDASSKFKRPPKVVIHLDKGGDYAAQQAFYDQVLEYTGPHDSGEGSKRLTINDFDIQAVTFSPFWGRENTFNNLVITLRFLQAKYRKEVMVVDAAWPLSCPRPKFQFPPDTASIGFSTEAQITYMKKLAGAISSSGGIGLFWFEGAWVTDHWVKPPCEQYSALLFERDGEALPSLNGFKDL